MMAVARLQDIPDGVDDHTRLVPPSLPRFATVIPLPTLARRNDRSVQRGWRLRGVVKIKIKPEELIRTG